MRLCVGYTVRHFLNPNNVVCVLRRVDDSLSPTTAKVSRQTYYSSSGAGKDRDRNITCLSRRTAVPLLLRDVVVRAPSTMDDQT